MSKQSLIQDHIGNTVEDLIKALNQFKTSGVNYLKIDGKDIDGLGIELVEETLTDGSKVHDINIWVRNES